MPLATKFRQAMFAQRTGGRIARRNAADRPLLEKTNALNRKSQKKTTPFQVKEVSKNEAITVKSKVEGGSFRIDIAL